MIRTLIFFTILLLAFPQWFVVALPLALYYIWRYHGFELIIVGLLIDGYYQAFYEVPFLSIFLVLSIVIINFLKPKLLLYTE